MTVDLQFMRMFADAVPHNRALGIQMLEAGPTGVRFRLPYDERLVGDPDTGVLHGGAVSALLDAACGLAVLGALPQPLPIATLDLRIDYLGPAQPGRDVLARAECYRLTSNVAFARAVAYHDDEASPFTTAAGTFMIGTRPS